MTQRDDQGRFTPEVPLQGQVQLLGWVNGVNLTAHPTRLAITELADARNVVLGKRGEVKLRPGWDQYDVFTDAQQYKWIQTWATDSLTDANGTGQDVFVAVEDTTNSQVVYRDALGARQEVVIAAKVPDVPVFIPFAGKGYFTSTLASSQYEIEPANIKTTGGPTLLTAWDPDSGSTTTQFPRCDIMMVAYERLFATNVQDLNDVQARKYRLYFSEPLLPKSWTATNYIDINPDDEQSITALRRFADQIIIFKERSIWGLAGDDFEGLNLQLYQIEGAIGTAAPQTIVDIGELLAFMDPTRGIYLFDGSALENIGEQVFDYMQDGWNDTQIDRATAWFHNGRYHISVPWGVDAWPSRTFVYDVTLRAWTYWDRGFSGVTILPEGVGTSEAPTSQKVIVVRAGTGHDGFLEVSDDILTEDGATFTFTVQTGWLSPSLGAQQHRIRNTEVALVDSGIAADLKAYTGLDTDAAQATVSLDASAGENAGIIKRTHALNGFRWRSLMLELTGTSDGVSTWQLNNIAFDVTSLPRKRGTA